MTYPITDLSFVDPECVNPQDKVITEVSGFIAGIAYNSICRAFGGNWPDCQLQEEAPEAHEFFMKLFGVNTK